MDKIIKEISQIRASIEQKEYSIDLMRNVMQNVLQSFLHNVKMIIRGYKFSVIGSALYVFTGSNIKSGDIVTLRGEGIFRLIIPYTAEDNNYSCYVVSVNEGICKPYEVYFAYVTPKNIINIYQE